MASKQKHISPVKGMNKCAAYEDNLNLSSSAINCDSCEQQLCADCLHLSEHEYIILAKMTHCMGYEQKYPMCKGNPKSTRDVSKVAKIMDSSIKNSLSSIDNAIKNLDSKN